MLAHIYKNSFMDIAIDEAKKALIMNEVPIGAIIVNESGNVISKAHNLTQKSRIATHHAEILAIEQACKVINNYKLNNCSIYVTAEPCLMCLGAILNSNIKRIYYGCPEPKYGAIESKYSIYNKISKRRIPEVYGNIQEHECKSILQKFFSSLRKK